MPPLAPPGYKVYHYTTILMKHPTGMTKCKLTTDLVALAKQGDERIGNVHQSV